MVLVPFPTVLNGEHSQNGDSFRYFAVSNGAGTQTKYYAAKSVDGLPPLEAVKRFLLSLITVSAGDIRDITRALAAAKGLGLDRLVEVTEEEARRSPRFHQNMAVYSREAAVIPLGMVKEETAAPAQPYQ